MVTAQIFLNKSQFYKIIFAEKYGKIAENNRTKRKTQFTVLATRQPAHEFHIGLRFVPLDLMRTEVSSTKIIYSLI